MRQSAPDIGRIIAEIEPEDAGCTLTLIQEGLPEGCEADTFNGWGKIFTAPATALS